MKTCGFPGTFAPRYQLLHPWKSVSSATVFTHATHSACASSVASIVESPSASSDEITSRMYSTCCSIDTTMLVSTDGLPGPVTVNRFGKPAT